MSNQYKVYLPDSPNFYGSTDGIRFKSGIGFVDESTIDPNLNLSVEEVVQKLEAAGYVAEIVKDGSTGLAVEVDADGCFITYDADGNTIRKNKDGQIVDADGNVVGAGGLTEERRRAAVLQGVVIDTNEDKPKPKRKSKAEEESAG